MNQRLTGRDIILGLIENLHAGIEPLLYTALAPGLFDVYLHPDDYERLAGVIRLIIDEAKAALDKTMDELNCQAPSVKWQLARLIKPRMATKVEYVKPASGWAITFHQHNDGEMQPGELLIESSLALADKPAMGATHATKRVRTLRTGGASRVISPPVLTQMRVTKPSGTHASAARNRPAVQSEAAYASLTWQNGGTKQTYWMTKNQLVIGRGGNHHWVDIKFESSPDISREHCRLRRDENTGEFFIRDLNRYGTAVNGQVLPSSLVARRDINRECPLPSPAKIKLADGIELDFALVEAV